MEFREESLYAVKTTLLQHHLFSNHVGHAPSMFESTTTNIQCRPHCGYTCEDLSQLAKKKRGKSNKYSEDRWVQRVGIRSATMETDSVHVGDDGVTWRIEAVCVVARSFVSVCW